MVNHSEAAHPMGLFNYPSVQNDTVGLFQSARLTLWGCCILSGLCFVTAVTASQVFKNQIILYIYIFLLFHNAGLRLCRGYEAESHVMYDIV